MAYVAVKPETASALIFKTPFAARAGLLDQQQVGGAPPAHRYGAASMQTYANGQVASHTHASADGFLAYVNQFEQTSFRAKDGQVEWWQYSPTFDDWQDNYGCDSVDVFYHAGHGGTDNSTGTYSAPLGASWDDQTSLSTTRMAVGDQRLRYLFLATCEGCMVFGPNNPIRTWHPPNRGLRMVFGATGDIFDNPDYGTRFWDHWRTGVSFSQAWQDALLDAGASQQPSSTACGSSAADASSRLFSERLFAWNSVQRDWYWWRWVGNAPKLSPGLSFVLPRELVFARITPRGVSHEHLLASLRAYGVEMPGELPRGPLEHVCFSDDGPRASILPGGGLAIEYHPAALQCSQLSEEQSAEIAQRALAGLGDSLRLARVMPALHAGGTVAGDGTLVDPETYEHVVTFRQEVAGMQVLTPAAGEVRVHVDHDGEIRRVVDTRLDIADVRDRGPHPSMRPTPSGEEDEACRVGSRDDVLEALRRAIPECHDGHIKQFSRLLPDSVEIGYSRRDNDLIPVARATVEFGTEQYRMLRAIEVPLAG
jgi:hypothetical protein